MIFIIARPQTKYSNNRKELDEQERLKPTGELLKLVYMFLFFFVFEMNSVFILAIIIEVHLKL